MPVFSDMKSVCNLLAKEFMNDILKITSDAGDEDISVLQKYLLWERGWTILRVIHKIGVQMLSNGRDLANLLVSLLPFCLKFPIPDEDAVAGTFLEVPLHPITECFPSTVRSGKGVVEHHRNTVLHVSKKCSYAASNSKGVRHKMTHKRNSSMIAKNNRVKSDDESENETVPEKAKAGKIRKRPRCLYAPNMQTQSKQDSDSDEDDIDHLLKRYQEKEESSISAPELCLLIIDLLFELCKLDSIQSSAVKYLSVTVMPHLLNALLSKGCDMEVTVARTIDWPEDLVICIQRHLLRVIFLACSFVAKQQNGVKIFSGHKVVSQLLEVCQKCEYFSSSNFSTDGNEPQMSRMTKEAALVMEVLTGLVICFDIVFQHLPFNPDYISSAVHMIEDFDDNQGFMYLRRIISFIDWIKLQSGDCMYYDIIRNEPIRLFGSFLSTLKVVKVNYIHSMKCAKRKHNRCVYSHYLDHHHDILGVPESRMAEQQSFSSSSPKKKVQKFCTKTHCLVASCTDFLMKLLTNVNSKFVRLEILRIIDSSGICCCMQLDNIVETFVKGITFFSPAVRSYSLNILNKIVLENFSGGLRLHYEDSSGFMCSTCEEMELRSKGTDPSIYHGTVLDTMVCLDSGFSSSDLNTDTKVSVLQKLSRWRPMQVLKDLLYSDNENLAVSVSKHLLALSIKGNLYLKAELFFSLYADTLGCSGKTWFSSACSSSEEEGDFKAREMSKSVQVHCLSALPYLLQANCVMKAFLTKKGITQMCCFLEDAELRAPVLRIFEALIILDQERLKSEENEGMGHGNNLCACPYKGDHVIGAFISELSRRSFKDVRYDQGETGYKQMRHGDGVGQDDLAHILWSLPVMVDMWGTCAKLCLNNSIFVSHFQDMLCMRPTESLLLETLQSLIKPSAVMSQTSIETEDSGLEGDQNISLASLQSKSANFFMRVSLLESLTVVCGAYYNFLEMENNVKPGLWRKIVECFDMSSKLEPMKLKVIFDALLSAAVPHYSSVMEYSYNRNICLVQTSDDDICDEDEVRQLLQSGSEDEQEVFMTEHGYEADNEESLFEEGQGEKLTGKELLGTGHSLQKVFFPSIFRLVVELLVCIQDVKPDRVVLNLVLHRLLQVTRMDSRVVKAMCNENILELILCNEGFWKPVTEEMDTDSGHQTLLALVQQLAQHSIGSHDFRRMLQLFQHSDIPTDNLLSVLLTIVENSPLLPYHSVRFPVKVTEPRREDNIKRDLLESGSFDQRPVHPSRVAPFFKAMSSILMIGAPKIHDTVETEKKLHYQEVWGISAIQTSLRSSLTWPPFQKGFSVAMWCQLVDDGVSSNTVKFTDTFVTTQHRVTSRRHGISLDNCLHLVSVGTREKLFEVWAKPEDGSLIFRLTSETAGVELVIQETARKNILPLCDWHHVVISYVEGLDGSTLTGQATVVIDGWQNHSFTLDHSISAIKSYNKSGVLFPQVCLGHVIEDPRSSALGTLSLGPVMFFKGAIESKDLCFHLYALGPNCQSISKCDRAEDIFTYAPLLKKNVVLQAKIQYDILVGLKKVSLDELRNSLLLMYNPKYSREISLYGAVSKGNMSGQLAANLGLTPDMAMLTQQPKQIIPTVQGHLRADINLSLEKAVEESGGLDAILFLIAKIYELCDLEKSSIGDDEAEKLQARALRVLFSVVHHSPFMAKEYAKINGNALLSKVLTISRSVVGYHTLKVLMDASTTESLFKMDPQSGALVLRPKSEALIRDASIIEQLLLNWQLWQNEKLADFVFQGLESLVREDHPHQTFNIKQFQVINIVRKIFKIYQERIQESEAALPVYISQRALYIIYAMIGSPPDYHLIIEICDFLLHVHPAANTYINHSRSTFYFTLWWGVPASPLTKWKQGLGREKTSTPVKEGQHKRSKGYKRSLTTVGIADGIERLPMSSDEKPSQGRSPKRSLQLEIGNKKSLITDTVRRLRSQSNPENSETQKKITTDTYLRAPSCDDSVKTVSLGFNPSFTVSHKKSSDDMVKENTEVEGRSSHEGLGRHDSQLHAEIKDEGKVCESSNQSQEEDSSCTSLHEESLNDKQWDNMSVSNRKDLDQDGNKKMKSAADQFDEEDMELFELEKGLITLCVGLLKLLCDTIVIMPDALLEKTLHNSINPQVFIVLAHHSSPEIRTWIIKVLVKYLEHCNVGYVESFLKMDGFQLLSAQLFQYPTYQEQFEAALSIVLARNFSFEDGLCLTEAVEEPSLVQQSAVQLTLALLGNSTGDLVLCHNALNVCTQLFESAIVLAGAMVDAGLMEVLSNMIIKVLEKESCPGDVEGFDESEMLQNDIQHFLCTMAVWEFSASGPEHYQQFEDILNLLKELETREDNVKGCDSKGVQTLRKFQYLILGKVLELVEQVSEEVSNQSFSIFPRQLSSPSRSLSSSYAASETSRLIPSHKYSLPLKKPSFSQSLLHQNTLVAAAAQGIRLSGSILSKAPPHKPKSTRSTGFYVLSDQPYEDILALSGDSDGSQDSFPSQKLPFSRAISMDVTHRRLNRSNSLLQSVLSIGKRKKLATIPISQNELIDRLKKLLIFATDLAMYTEKRKVEERRVLMLFERAKHTVNIEREYQRKLFDFTYNAFEATLPHERNLYKRTKNVIMWGAKDVIRVQLGRMLSLLLSPEQELDQKVYAMSYMMMEKRGTEALKAMCTSLELGSDLGYYVYNILANCRSWLSNQQNEDGSKFINLLRGMGFTIPSPREVPPAPEVQEMLKDKCRTLENRNAIQKTAWLKKREYARNRIFHKFDNTASQLCGHAMETTQAVTQLQTLERNKFVTHIKQTMTDRIQVKKQWQEIVQNLTHERAVWFDKKSYPQSWQLNPTEGPCRVRKRLQRGQLGIDARFLKENYRYKLDAEAVDPPLIYLFEDDHQMADKAPLIYQLHKNKKIRYTSTCWVVSPSNETKGELLIGEDSVFFVADEAMTDANYTQVLLGNKDQLSMTWPYEDIREIHKRWYQLMDKGLEIFLTSGKTCLLAFKSITDRDDLYMQLMELELPNRINTELVLDMLSQWEDGRLTNFEYLTHLNKAAGRSFNDLMQYPVFPFILKDYTSETLDLKDPSIYRDLSRPIAVQDVASEERYKNNYQVLKQEYERRNPEDPSSLQVAPYHYGSHYSNSGTVLHFLVRLPPFTKMFLNFQDQNFDIPDRTFHSMHTAWRLSSADSTTDVKELIPEFFFLPEFFRNSEGFDLGRRQTGDIVWDVTLPPWCKNNPRLFILIHRQALESDFISQNIHNWIDLVFGYKQQGENAVKAINVFHPATYFGIDVNNFEDQLTRRAIRTMVKTYGQTPKQLFRVPHPTRLIITETDTRQRGQWRHVKGLKWGCYLGSLDMPDPECVWEEQYSSEVASLVPIKTGFVYGISAKSCVLAVYSQDKSAQKDIAWQAIMTWGHPDNIIRIINGKDKPAINFLHHSQFEELTCCLSVPDCRYLFTGGTSGVITMYSTKYNPAKESELQVFGHKKCLYGHTKAITSIVVCKPYSILVSASEDETCIIWDLNRLSYVRSIEGHRSGVKVIAVSDTMGDIASISNCGMGSYLQLHTVNAEHVATVKCEDSINCLTFSGAPEGISINVIVGGLSSGIIRIWSSWDLTPVRDLRQKDLLSVPVISVAYTCDSQKLYISSCDGRVMLWDYSNQPRSKQPRFKPFLFPS
ncbi:hypothetical protein CHS0354_008265 [Potamilus streckersoni]|uniref:Lysosomal-trafficking regulator n=1 Tax=Potamilus streckersoni TaxID=2493646 RepID=A0AAE0T7P3_9BIVA|nr:hypothetical protein CHS0354_008265 [Potamilus streckersoni]